MYTNIKSRMVRSKKYFVLKIIRVSNKQGCKHISIKFKQHRDRCKHIYNLNNKFFSSLKMTVVLIISDPRGEPRLELGVDVFGII